MCKQPDFWEFEEFSKIQLYLLAPFPFVENQYNLIEEMIPEIKPIVKHVIQGIWSQL